MIKTFKLFVGGFPRDLEEVELEEIVSEYGQVVAVKIVRDKKTGISRRFGFVEMAFKEDARRVIEMLNEGTIDGEVLGVKEAVVNEKPGSMPARRIVTKRKQVTKRGGK